MFFEGDRIDAMREMILAQTLNERKAAVAKLLPYQRGDFVGIFRELKGLPATIRFLDPPLHEFLPNTEAQQKDLAKKLNVPFERIARRVEELLSVIGKDSTQIGCRGRFAGPKALSL